MSRVVCAIARSSQSLPSRRPFSSSIRCRYAGKPLQRARPPPFSTDPKPKEDKVEEEEEEEELELKTILRKLIPERREKLKELKSHADKKIGEVKVENVLGGMRGLKSMLWDGSVLDANDGIRFHGRTIAECSELLPKGWTGQEMLPEAMFWLLLTGQIPTQMQVDQLSRWLAKKSRLLPQVFNCLKSTPSYIHPMTRLASGVSLLNATSTFARKYAEGTLDKKDYWESTFDDALNLLAKLPSIAAQLYGKDHSAETWRGKDAVGKYNYNADPQYDWAYNLALKLGKGGKGQQEVDFQDLLRLYLSLHADHEGGNVSAHATRLVGSALSDPFLAYSAGLQGLAGPLHGLAAQEVLTFIQKMHSSIPSLDPASIRTHLWSLLKSGQVIPGYGHAVLRRPDPRFEALMNFGLARPSIAADPLFQLVKMTSEVAPEVLTEHGKTKNPFPNVDSVSGVLLNHFGFKDQRFYTVIFGVSRAIGPMAQLIWDRALGLPIERPKSVDMNGLLKLAKAAD